MSSPSPPILCPLPRRSAHTHHHASITYTRARRTPSISTSAAARSNTDSCGHRQRRRSSVGNRSAIAAAKVKEPEDTAPVLGYKEDVPAAAKTEDDVMSEFLSLFSATPGSPAIPLPSHSPVLLSRTFTASPRQQRRFAPRPRSRIAFADDIHPPSHASIATPPPPPAALSSVAASEEVEDKSMAGYAWLLGSPISRCRAPAPDLRRVITPFRPLTPSSMSPTSPNGAAAWPLLLASPSLGATATVTAAAVEKLESSVAALEEVRLGSPAPSKE